MSNVQTMDIVITILTIAVIFGGYALKKLHETVSSYGKSFGEESGKIDATTQKLDDIQVQLAQSVEITESIKKEIEQGAWRERELELLKREKLEAYLMCFYAEKENLTHKMREAFFKVAHDYDREAGSKLSMLKILYLPELNEEHASFSRAHAKFMTWVAEGQTMMVEQMKAGEQVPKVTSVHMENYPTLLQSLNECSLAMEAKVKEIGQGINNA
jgi:hypothetical protein